MWHALFLGLGYGIGLAFLPGPAFFKIIQAGIALGFRAGFNIALGIAASDLFYILLVYFGLSSFMDGESFKSIMGTGGGFILLAFGLTSIFKKSTLADQNDSNETQALSRTENFKLFTKGFTINFLNPAALFFWIATYSAARLDKGITEEWHYAVFFGAIITAVFGTDCLKAGLSTKLKPYITSTMLRRLNIVIGVLLVGFGIKLLVETFFRQ